MITVKLESLGQFPAKLPVITVAPEGERTSEKEETLKLLAKSQVIAPISIANLQFSYPGIALFYARTGGITSSRRITLRL